MRLWMFVYLLVVGWCLAGEYPIWPETPTEAVPGAHRFPGASIRMLNGAGTLVVADQPQVRIAIASTSDHSASLAEKVDCGMRLVMTRAMSIGGPSLRQQVRGQLDASIAKIQDAIPDAWILLRINIEPTKEFLAAHPGSWVTGEKGETVFQERFNRRFQDIPAQRPSWASLAWRGQVDEELRDLIGYVASQPYSRLIVGIALTAGHTGEFDQWFGGEGWPGGNGGDYCADSVSHFRDWLRARYDGDESRLRAAWGEKEVTFETALIEGVKAQLDMVLGCADPAVSGGVLDYQRFHGEQREEAIISWCRSIKLASGGRFIAGAMHAVGDGGSRLMLTSPWVDFGAGPGTYFYREPGNHRRLDFTGENLRRTGKWFLEEMDMRTLNYGAEEYGVETLEKTLSVLERTHAQITTEGVDGYWYEFRSATFQHPAIWRLFRRQAEISELAARHDRQVPTDVVVLYGEDLLGADSGDLRTNLLSRIGTPYHAMHVETLVEQDPATLPYKVYIFANVPELTTAQRDFLRQHVMKNGNWVICLRPVGAVLPGANPPACLANSTALHGINLAPLEKLPKDDILYVAQPPIPDVVGGAPIADKEDDVPRHPRRPSQTQVDDPAATPLALWPGGEVAAAIKQQAGFTAVYVATQRVSPPLLRSLVKAAGAHQYEDNGDDVIYAGGKLLNIHTRRDGVRHLRLREPADLYDLYTDQFVGRGQAVYDIPMAALENHLYWLGDPRTELAEIRESMDNEILRRRYLVERRRRQRLEQLTAPVDSGPHNLLDNGKLRNFLFLGPAPLVDVPEDQWVEYEKKILPETQIKGGVATLKPEPFKREQLEGRDEMLAWRPLFSGESSFYAADFYEQPERRLVFYVGIYLETAKGGEYNLHLRTERGHNLYLDGVKIGESFYRGPHQLDFKLKLDAGRRHLLVAKVYSAGGGNTGWTAALTTSNGAPASDVRLFYKP